MKDYEKILENAVQEICAFEANAESVKANIDAIKKIANDELNEASGNYDKNSELAEAVARFVYYANTDISEFEKDVYLYKVVADAISEVKKV